MSEHNNKSLDKKDTSKLDKSTKKKFSTIAPRLDLKFFTVEQIAHVLQLEKMSIYRYIKAGKLVAHKFGSEFRIEEADFNSFLENAKKCGIPKSKKIGKRKSSQ